MCLHLYVKNSLHMQTKAFSVPNRSLVTVDGNCSDSSGNSTFRYMSLTWKEGGEENFTLTFNFTVTKKEWYLSQIRVEFEMSDNTFEMPKGMSIVMSWWFVDM